MISTTGSPSCTESGSGQHRSEKHNLCSIFCFVTYCFLCIRTRVVCSVRNIHFTGGYVIRTYIFNITTDSMVTGMVVMQQNDGQSSLVAPGLQLRTVNPGAAGPSACEALSLSVRTVYSSPLCFVSAATAGPNYAALQLKVMISVCETTSTRTAIVAMQQTESDRLLEDLMLYDMLRTCAARSI